MKKQAECIRQTENWSVQETYHKMDNVAFDPVRVKADLPIVSPKMHKLIEHIAELDEKDMREHKTLFKHLIFSDLKSIGGAKSVGSALLANGYSLIYNKTLQLTAPAPDLNAKNFAILCSTKIYNKDVGVRFRQKILDRFNSRPANVHGEDVRFIVLDYGFKEGIDLFDVKHVHIMESPITEADKKQIIGRSTRFCGQRGLHFDKKRGWPLYVYVYNSELPKEVVAMPSRSSSPSSSATKVNTMFDLFVSYSNIDIVKDIFANELTKRSIQSSIDYQLNKPIHIYGQAIESDFLKLDNDVRTNFRAPIINMPKELVEKYGTKLEMNGPFNCIAGCKNNVMLIPTEVMLIAWYLQRSGKNASYIVNHKRPRGFLCIELTTDGVPAFCNKLQEIWKDHEGFIIRNEKKILDKLTELKSYRNAFVDEQIRNIKKYIEPIVEMGVFEPIAPPTQMDYFETQAFMKRHYNTLKWPEVVMENLCALPTTDKATDNSTDLKKILFTPTQQALQKYFTPSSAYKGLLVWHSTGTGKTCSGVSIASNGFEKAGYTILWVTRNTLRGDIWKNMYKQICSISMQEKGEKIDVDDALRHPMRYVSKNWIEPITYKQFSNLLLGKNEYYAEMVKRNGEADPLRKTLIVIDEAHKLLSHDLKAQEKPDFNILHKKILDSYEISKADSVKLLLMTATPYSEDPMQMIKLLNLMRSRSDQFPSDFNDFKDAYLTSRGKFAKPIDFLSKASGYISYLNRETDMRQFAYPIIENIVVPISRSQKVATPIDEIQAKIDFALETIEANEAKKREAKAKLKGEKKTLEDACKKIKNKEEKAKCLAKVKAKEGEFASDLFAEADEMIKTEKANIKNYKKEIQEASKAAKNYRENDPSQERVLKEKCLPK